jgi:hypothetical protein
MKFTILRILCFMLLVQTIAAQNFTLSGYITDGGNGESLIGANVLVMNGDKKMGASTNEYGFFSLTLPTGDYEAKVSYLGFKEQVFVVKLSENRKLNVALVEEGSDFVELIVESEKANSNVTNAQMGVEKLDMATIEKLPMIFGERDILKAIQLLPGVKSNGEGQSGFTVRGGAADQNLLLLDDAPVYNASHLLGFFSTFNSDAIKDVSLYKGTAPAQFGGRLASVVDIKMKEGNNQGWGVHGGLGLISSKLNVEGPLQKGKSSFLLSGRRTYADVFLKLDERFKDNILYFYDLNAKVNYKFSDKSRLYLSGYFGRDVLGLADRFSIDWGNATGTLRWNYLLSDKWFSNTSFIYSNYDYKIEIQNDNASFSIFSRVRDWNLKQEFQYFPNTKNEWRFGYNVIHHTAIPGKVETEAFSVNLGDNKYGLESALYATNNWKLSDKLNVIYGLRLSNYMVLGGSDYYNLDQNNDVIDTFNQSGVVSSYYNFEPRLSMSYILSDKHSIKGAYTRNTQNIHLISNSVTTSPTDKWVLNTNIIRPEIADQVSLGYFRNFNDNMFECSIEAYYKAMQNQIDYKDGADEFNSIIETQLLYGKGRAYGAEFLVKKNKGKLTGWLGYTLSRTEKQITGINNGTWYAARQDRTHDISVVAMYDVTKRINVSAVFVYQTGNAVSFPTGKYEINGQTVWLYSERNGYRMPAYHRLDLAATFQLKERKHFNSEIAISLYNAYGRENAYIITFEQSEADPTKTVAVQTSLFRWVPSISWNFNIK